MAVRKLNDSEFEALTAKATKNGAKKQPETEILLKEVSSLEANEVSEQVVKKGKDAEKERSRIHTLLKSNKQTNYVVRIDPEDSGKILIWRKPEAVTQAEAEISNGAQEYAT